MLNYFVIQVRTRGEERYKKLVERSCRKAGLGEGETGRLLWLRRKLTERRKGKECTSDAPVFPGYLFLEAEELREDVYWILKRSAGFQRFLTDGERPEPLGEGDRRLLLHFLAYGEIVERSLVYFDANQRIQVVRGPMKGLEGRIVKVDKRKKRAKIRLDLYKDSFLVDFGFELLVPSEQNLAEACPS
jgi:transcriptional antiterminator NusG